MTQQASSSTPAGAPWAQRQQNHHDGHDLAFTARVVTAHPRAQWWWGQRTVGNVHGAWCYLCEQMVTTWARAYPMTATARTEIGNHRRDHVEGRL